MIDHDHAPVARQASLVDISRAGAYYVLHATPDWC